MTTLDSLRLPPYRLDDAAVAWVRSTLDGMGLDSRLRQLFALALLGDDLRTAHEIAAFGAGSVVRSPGSDAQAAWDATQAAVHGARVPMLVAADIEGGVNHPASLAPAPNAMAVAACNDLDLTTKTFAQMAIDAKAHGYNWSLGPVIDINHTFRSAIVGTRSFGSDTKVIAAQAVAYVRAMQDRGIAATAKHWPGEGHDERDQHLLTTVNPLTVPAWSETFGSLYRSLIESEVLTVMSAHIAFPAYAREAGESGVEQFRPASVSRHLNQTLLRETLGFNGLVVSDATAMAGLTSWGEAAKVIPELIANGCDILLFSVDSQRDLELLHDAVSHGQLSQERVEEAVIRILGVKAALGLHAPAPQRSSRSFTTPPEAVHRARLEVYGEVAAKSVTLVKDVRGLLPLSPAKHRRILVLEQQPKPLFPGFPAPSIQPLLSGLSERGFEIVRATVGTSLPVESVDALLYVLTQEAMLTVSEARIDWARLHGGFPASMERPWRSTPSVMVSFGHPYHLFDAPRMPAYINAYVCTPESQAAVVRKLVGEEPFLGHSPVDPFCQSEQARY
jgi:beta-N-acetylhexosaminidase